ncbi:hypothetical protein J8F10_30455 [Gemmata sp. G18]|uniref:S49 family peptidase n=1 Tax=Gemmata palustris TaxID=2822762 RepID=A0ABS5C0R9_9BACT|nr:hypothetical protein [Gemmata palustris]MBP3959588.1 hypothetical protein [Gemmata palustris]
MPDWNQVLNELRSNGSNFDVIRRKYLRRLHKLTKRNVIIYYSGWLQKRGVDGMEVNDADKNGLMTVVHQLDRKKGLDLLLHTPGGDAAATESLVQYLRSMFGSDIRAIIPQLAMSAGTMIACACKSIVMGKQSSLGPIDPQFGGIPAHGVVEEFRRACQEIAADRNMIPIWQPIIAKYHPTFIGECEKAIEWSQEMVADWLTSGMFAGEDPVATKGLVDRIVTDLSDHATSKSHSRHLSAEKCRDIGLKIVDLESDQPLQEAVLSVHHACIHTLSGSAAYKIIENHTGKAMIIAQQQVFVQASPSDTN